MAKKRAPGDNLWKCGRCGEKIPPPTTKNAEKHTDKTGHTRFVAIE